MKLYSVKEVMDMTGVSRDMLIEYEKRELLHPLRTGKVANNRRMYREEDIDELGKVVALRAYEFSLDDIGRILGDEDADIYSILEDQLEELRRKENHLRNLILFAKFVDITDTELFAGLLQGPEDIDAFADAMRGTEAYEMAMERIQGLSDEGIEQMVDELYGIIHGFATLDEIEGFRGVERQMDAYLDWWGRHIVPMEVVGYLGFWAIFEDDTLLPMVAEGIGGESASADLQMSLFYLCMKRLMVAMQAQIRAVAEAAGEDVVGAMEEAGPLAAAILSAMVGAGGAMAAAEGVLFTEGAREICLSALEYMGGIVADRELMGYLDPAGEIGLDAAVLDRAGSIMALLPTVGDSEGDEAADLDAHGVGDAP